MKAWHFVRDTLRDGRPVPADGEKLVHDGELVMCRSGLHASESIIDALNYAPGSIVCRVELSGEVIHDDDKSVASERTILWRVRGGALLRDFARKCALDVIHLWDAPDAARVAAWDTARSASWTARNAARVAWDAARVAWDAARDARAVARDARAAWDAQNERLEAMVRDAL